MQNKPLCYLIPLLAFIAAVLLVPACAEKSSHSTSIPAPVATPTPAPSPVTNAATPAPSGIGAIAASADKLVKQLQAQAPVVETGIGAGPKTSADVQAGLWAADVILQAMQGHPITASELDTGIPSVNNVLQANLSGNDPTQADLKKIAAVIAATNGQ